MSRGGSKKRSALEALIARTRQELASAIGSQRHTQEAAIHEESKPENDKDTRAVESSYLARGQAERVASLESTLAQLTSFNPREFSDGDRIAVGALLQVADESGRRCYFLVPAGGGGALQVDGDAVQPVTPNSPVGRALLGKSAGEEVEFRAPSGLKEWSIEAVE